MTANGFGLDDKVNKSGDTMTGTLGLAGKPALQIPEGTNACMGTATLNGTTAVTVTTTAVDSNTRIFLTIQTPGGTVGAPYVSSITAGTSFAVKSTSGSDTSTVAWMLVDHT